MEIKKGLVPGYFRLREVRELSREAKQRVKWFDYYKGHGNNGALTCRYFGISRKTFYKWRRIYDPGNIGTLNDRSRKPRHTRPADLGQGVGPGCAEAKRGAS